MSERKDGSKIVISRRDSLRLVAGATTASLFSGTSLEAFAASSTGGIVSPVREQIFNADWLFHLGDIYNGQAPNIDDNGWRLLDVPHDFMSEDLPNQTGTDQATSSPALWSAEIGRRESVRFNIY